MSGLAKAVHSRGTKGRRPRRTGGEGNVRRVVLKIQRGKKNLFREKI